MRLKHNNKYACQTTLSSMYIYGYTCFRVEIYWSVRGIQIENGNRRKMKTKQQNKPK